MKDIYIIQIDRGNEVDKGSYDLEFKEFSGSDSILPGYLTSDNLDLKTIILEFDALEKDFIKYDLLSNNMSWPIVSNRFMSLINIYNNKCVSIRTKIFHAGLAESEKYLALQIPVLSNIVDRSRSIYEDHPFLKRRFSIISKLQFLQNQATEPLFRIEEYPRIIFANSNCGNSLIEAELVGVEIVKLKNYIW